MATRINASPARQRVFRARFKLTSAGLISHITQRAAGKDPLFLENGDYLSFLKLFKETSEKYDLEIMAFCLMPNHVHIQLRPRLPNLEKAMHGLFCRYANSFNRKYHRRGHLFCGRYRQAVCLDQTYLLAASAYIHLNPVRAGLIRSPDQYRWSSCSLYLREQPTESFVAPEFVLELLSKNRKVAVQEYRTLLSDSVELKPENALEKTGAVEKFCGQLGKLFPHIFQKLRQPEGNKHSRSPTPDDPFDLETTIAALKDNKYSRTPQNQTARRHAVEQLLARGFTKQEIAHLLGLSRKTIYNILHPREP